MNRYSIILLLSITMGWLSSCSGSQEEIPPAPATQDKLPISWQIESQESVESKALMGTTALQGACTPDVNGESESIGVWGSYDVDANGQTFTYLEFDATPLTYGTKTEDTTNPHNDWNYPGENKLWEPGARYTFRACFPQKRMTSLMTNITPNVIQGIVPTTTVQEDLLAASAFVRATGDNLRNPVELKMKHLLAAVKFSVKAQTGYAPGENEKVNSCWLENKDDDGKRFSTSGYLVYNGVGITENIAWTKAGSSSAKMYHWEHQTGIAFNETESHSLYVNDNDANTVGAEYCNNDGWVLIVPQENDGSLYFGYTLGSAPGLSFSVPLPAITYQPGKMYSYVLIISGSEAKVTLSIADWNLLDSSYDLIL